MSDVKFKVGDEVIRVHGDWGAHNEGDIDVVYRITSDGSLTFKDKRGEYDERNYALTPPSKVPPFKKGDSVKVVIGGYGMAEENANFRKTIYEVEEYSEDGYFWGSGVLLKGYESSGESWVCSSCLELVPSHEDTPPLEEEDRSSYHKHYDCIVAWAQGKNIEIQRETILGDYYSACHNPRWLETIVYRVAPSKSPQEVQLEVLLEELKATQKKINTLKELM